MPHDLAIITAIYDGYDELKPALEQTGLSVDWVLVTDNEDATTYGTGWRKLLEQRPGVHPNRAAKRPKMLPWEYTDAPSSIWIDASFRIMSPSFAVDVMEHARPITQFGHPSRDCIYTEAALSGTMPKYAGEPLEEQMSRYRLAEHPQHWGLWATGLIGRHHTAEVKEFGKLWLEQCELWSFQDQVSEAYALRKTGLRPVELPGAHWSNPWVHYEASGRH